jgi:siroheme decarboxylase
MESTLKQITLDGIEQELIAIIQNGLPISNRPYAEISQQLSLTEDEVINRISDLKERGLFKRFGVVVRHHELGYRENAMIIWNVPDYQVQDIAKRIKSYPFITLCYRRARQLPEWPYNLYCMIHGKSRKNVMLLIQAMIDENHWQNIPQDVLFSKRRFKQTAANYMAAKGN